MTREMSVDEACAWCRQCCDPFALVDNHGILATTCHHIRLPLADRRVAKEALIYSSLHERPIQITPPTEGAPK